MMGEVSRAFSGPNTGNGRTVSKLHPPADQAARRYPAHDEGPAQRRGASLSSEHRAKWPRKLGVLPPLVRGLPLWVNGLHTWYTVPAATIPPKGRPVEPEPTFPNPQAPARHLLSPVSSWHNSSMTEMPPPEPPELEPEKIRGLIAHADDIAAFMQAEMELGQ